jgi:hypothetical protein
MKRLDGFNYEDYDGREGCLVILIGLGTIAASIIFIGSIYLIFFYK